MRRVVQKSKTFFLTCFVVAFTTQILISLRENTKLVIWQSSVLNGREVYYKPGMEYANNEGLISKHCNFAKSHTSSARCNLTLIHDLLPVWNSRCLIKTDSKSRYKAFKQVITQAEHSDMMELLQTFKSVCESNDLQFMMYGGSLLGAYRHFGLIPWDDDIDVLMNISHANKIKSAFKNVSGFSLTSHVGRQWKFYRNSSTVNGSCCSLDETENQDALCQCNQWPYIDIFFFRENETHIWDSNRMYSDVYCYKKSDVFPLISFPFENHIIPVPRNIRTILDKSYNVDLCVTLHFSHRAERRAERIHTVPCKRLFPYFPFVFEFYQKNVWTRSLIQGNEQFYQISFEVE